ncbi:cell wall assembly/cell protein, KNR4 [Haloferula helveola]|uniref:Cell wall assembly/cell protein, KNR4 n=1 Tax=Haloferula helveola TaxID=490095 RepID=A0ABM7RAQ3_9BACT|nr:cell wall assembly/cell protein, KNR4 [Haloferula helveola]
MSEWHKRIVAFHKLDNADDPDSLVLGSPASAASIAEFEKAIGYSMPDEFKELYSEYDGFGTSRDGETDWFFLPISKLPEHASEIRDWFQETHPELAKRFVPFVDWGNGDASGYVFSETGTLLPGIFIFEHESYEFEEDQGWEEFLIPVDSSIRAFLTE